MPTQRYLTEDKFLECVRVILGRLHNAELAQEVQQQVQETLLTFGACVTIPTKPQITLAQEIPTKPQITPAQEIVVQNQHQHGNGSLKMDEVTQSPMSQTKTKKQPKVNLRSLFFKVFFAVNRRKSFSEKAIKLVHLGWRWLSQQADLMQTFSQEFKPLLERMNQDGVINSEKQNIFEAFVQEHHLDLERFVPDQEVLMKFAQGDPQSLTSTRLQTQQTTNITEHNQINSQLLNISKEIQHKTESTQQVRPSQNFVNRLQLQNTPSTQHSLQLGESKLENLTKSDEHERQDAIVQKDDAEKKKKKKHKHKSKIVDQPKKPTEDDNQLQKQEQIQQRRVEHGEDQVRNQVVHEEDGEHKKKKKKKKDKKHKKEADDKEIVDGNVSTKRKHDVEEDGGKKHKKKKKKISDIEQVNG
eukprot:TRINITY_DN60350_c0_g2_i1.p1 TRINITY_DN60350_c0_g2~~TRINITY_DN60350_c0_g2_i1.p1  ORF type:complete len:414 (-),score=66.56 TRINITY_DN60350_c0_g2_i1:186-1427(-)